jgi:hypothetical protein
MLPLPDLVALYGLPAVGVILTAAIYASSFPVVRRARVLRNIENLDATTLTVQFLNAQAWVEYARIVQDPFIWTANTVGLVLTTFYVATVLELAVANGKLAIRGKVEVIYAIGMVILIALTMSDTFVCGTVEIRAAVSGMAANAFAVLMCLAPALNIYTACRQGSAACIQIGLNVAALACNATWTIYGLFKGDPFIYVGCIIGLASASAQLLIVLVFLRSDRAHRRLLAKQNDLQRLKASAVQDNYAKQSSRWAGGYLPLDFNSDYLQQRLALRAETGHPLVTSEQHETTTTALLGVPIDKGLTEVVLHDLAKDASELQVVVRPGAPTDPAEVMGKAPPQAWEVVEQLLEQLRRVTDVECRQVDDGQGPHAVYTVSILPKDDGAVALGTPLRGEGPHSPLGAGVPTIELQLGRGGHFTISCGSLASDADPPESVSKPASPQAV